ncbi:hypothetical protein FPOA_13948, partial [Fusarium poae]
MILPSPASTSTSSLLFIKLWTSTSRSDPPADILPAYLDAKIPGRESVRGHQNTEEQSYDTKSNN